MRILLTILLLFPLLMQGQTRPILFYDDCEGNKLTSFVGNCPTTNAPFSLGWTSRQGSTSIGSITKSTNFARKGTYSYRHELFVSSATGWVNQKAELAWNFVPSGSPLGTVGCNNAFTRPSIGLRWASVSSFIPSSTVLPSDPNFRMSFAFNTKAVEDDYPTPTSLEINNGRYRFGITRINANGSATTTLYDAGPIIRDIWVDWKMHRNFRQDGHGFVRLYRNDTLVVEYTGANWIVANHSREPYMQMGLYRFSALTGNPIVMYLDEYRFGDSTATQLDMSVEPDESPNIPPTVSIITPTPTGADSIQVIAQSSDVDGTISSRVWSIITGPNTPSTLGTNGDTLRLSGLIAGIYIYRIKVTDNDGASDSADVTITVNPPAAGSLGIIFRDDVEAPGKPIYGGASADITQYYNNRIGLTSNVLIRTSEQKNNGNYSYKFSLKNQVATGFLNTDNENVWNFIPSTTAIGINWYAASIFIPLQNQNDNTPSTVLFNKFPYPFDEDKPMYLDIVNNTWKFKIRKFNSSGTDLGLDTINVGDVSYDTWTNWAVQRNWTLNDSGYVRLYRNKTLVYEYNGPNFNPSGKRPEPYSHWGIWKPAYDTAVAPNKDSIVIFLDDIVVAGYAASLDSVSPNISPTVVIDPIPPITGTTAIAVAYSNDLDGSITSRTWTFISGPSAASVTGSSGDTLNASGMIDTGNYVYQITVVDNFGIPATDRITITKQTVFNQPPTVTAPEDLTFTNDATLVVMIEASDSEDGSDLSYQWSQISGPISEIVSDTSKNLIIRKPIQGAYQFSLNVTDTQGASTIIPVRFVYERDRGRVIRIKPGAPLKVIK